MLWLLVALGALELNVVTGFVVIATVSEGGVGKGSCIRVGRVGSCQSAG